MAYVDPAIAYDDPKYWRQIDTHCKGKVAAEVFFSLYNQLTSGIWGNARGIRKYTDHLHFEFDEATGKVKLYVCASKHVRYYSLRNPFYNEPDNKVKEWIAFRIKCCVKEEENRSEDHKKIWKRKDNTILSYFGGTHARQLKVSDVYAVYDVLRGRKASFSTKFKTLDESQLEEIAAIEQKINDLSRECSKINDNIRAKINALYAYTAQVSEIYNARKNVMKTKIARIKQSVMD